MCIFGQEFDPAKYFVDWACTDFAYGQKKYDTFSENKVFEKWKFSKLLLCINFLAKQMPQLQIERKS